MSASQAPTPPQRANFIDRLRVFLAVLVILHHAAITYGASGGWFYREVTCAWTSTSLLLTALVAVNQAFFMGMFFLLAGYFTPDSLRRKGWLHFLVDRLLRLGIPLVVFGVLLGPLSRALAGHPAGHSVLQTWLDMVGRGTFVVGPLWFALALLLFSLGWVLWTGRPQRPTDTPALRGDELAPWPAWLLSALCVGGCALLIRLWVPVGESVAGLQLGYFASYAFLFYLGCRAATGRRLERLTARDAVTWGVVSVFTMPWIFIVGFLEGALDGKPVNFSGGLGLAAVVYAFWEPLVAWGVIAALLYVFRARFNQPSLLWGRCAGNAYTAFVVHAPVLVGLSVVAAQWRGPAALKFAVVGSLAVLSSFTIAAALRKLPYVDRVL
jgi:peptidoglycan/LPS O-acetylase OafA/YrhL